MPRVALGLDPKFDRVVADLDIVWRAGPEIVQPTQMLEVDAVASRGPDRQRARGERAF